MSKYTQSFDDLKLQVLRRIASRLPVDVHGRRQLKRLIKAEADLIKQGLLQLESDGRWHVSTKGYKYMAEHAHTPRRQAYARKKRGY